MELAQFGSHAGVSTAVQALGDPDPQVRVAAIENLPSRLEESRLVRELVSRLDDPVRAVRHAAARTLAGVSPGLLRGTERERLQAVIEDYHLGLLVNNDRAGSHLARGSLFESLHADEQAVEAYRTAMQVEPHVTGPRTNLAATCERLAEAAEAAARQAEVMQDETIRKPAADRALAYRQEARELRVEELGLLARDVKLLPNAAGLQYRYGMLLYLQRRFDEAEAALLEASRLEPFHPQFLLGVVLFYRERKQPEKALPLAERLVALRPEDPMYRQVLEELKPR
jgi:tetratricopeptide (TPR) repeat protein